MVLSSTFVAAFFGDGLDLGRRRRALAAAKAEHLTRAGARKLGRSRRAPPTMRAGLLRGLRTRLRPVPVGDEVIEQRVRAALGRASKHVSLIGVAVRDGNGDPGRSHPAAGAPARAANHAAGQRCARVDDRLEEHARADIPQLRDGRPRGRRSAPQPRLCSDMMKIDPQFVREGEPLRLAAEILSAANIGFLPVCDQRGKVVGTVTDRDIVVRAVARGSIPSFAASTTS